MPKPPKAEMIRGFIEEVKSYIPSLADGLDALRTAPDKGETLEETHRLVHTIKGAASMVGLTGLSKIALQMEDCLDDIIAGRQAVGDRSLAAMQKTIERFQEYCRSYLEDINLWGGEPAAAILTAGRRRVPCSRKRSPISRGCAGCHWKKRKKFSASR